MLMEMYCGLLLFINSNRILLDHSNFKQLCSASSAACSADLRGFQSPGTACLFSAVSGQTTLLHKISSLAPFRRFL